MSKKVSLDYYSDKSRTSVSSGKSRRSGKSLGEKIRELGFNLRHERPPTIWVNMQYMDIKMEDNRPSKISIMMPKLNLEQITYHQPEIAFEGPSLGKKVYKISPFETQSKGPKEITKITDIEVKSFKPVKKIKFRKKKRHSSIISKIDGILNRGKELLPSRDPSEESVSFNYESRDQPMKTINDLPESVLNKVFLYFPQKERCLMLSRVCKSWYYILKDPVFWTELDFFNDQVKTETAIDLIRKYSTLRKLRLTSMSAAVEILVELCRCNHSITHLGVRHCNVSNLDFSRIILRIISCCTQLEALDVKGMQFQPERFYLELGRLTNLKSLNLTGNKFLRNQDLITLSINCRSLKELRILDITSDRKFQFALRDEDVTFITAHLQQNLETFKIDMQRLGDVSYQAILKCSSLKCLALKNCLLLSSNIFRQFPVLANLKKLKITRAINLKAEDFRFVFDHNSLENIYDLDINGCWGVGEIGLEAITSRLTSIKCLSLKNCSSIKGSHLCLLGRCPDLRNLNVAHADVESDHLLTLDRHVRNLESLVTDSDACKKSTARSLMKSFPFLKITLSFSKYEKDERLLQNDSIFDYELEKAEN